MFTMPISRSKTFVRPSVTAVALFPLLSIPNTALAVTIDMVTIGDPGNSPDDTGFGAVDYTYRIGKFEVINEQYAEFLNAVAKDDPHSLYASVAFLPNADIARSGGPGSYSYSVQQGRENKPVQTWASLTGFWSSLRFANWLHNGQPSGPQDETTTEAGAYTFTGPISILGNRNPEARWFLPAENEWYKAAYYKGGGTDAGYWEYPTSSDIKPVAELPPGSFNSANFDFAVGDLTDVGAYSSAVSPYGTFDQGGNAWEMVVNPLGPQFGPRKFERGGGFGNVDTFDSLAAPNRFTMPIAGFRVAAIVPESEISADSDGDLDVDGRDFLVLQRIPVPNFQAWESVYGSSALNNSQSIPEPTTSVLLLGVGLVTIVSCGRFDIT